MPIEETENIIQNKLTSDAPKGLQAKLKIINEYWEFWLNIIFLIFSYDFINNIKAS